MPTSPASLPQCRACGRRRPLRISAAYDHETPSTVAIAETDVFESPGLNFLSIRLFGKPPRFVPRVLSDCIPPLRLSPARPRLCALGGHSTGLANLSDLIGGEERPPRGARLLPLREQSRGYKPAATRVALCPMKPDIRLARIHVLDPSAMLARAKIVGDGGAAVG
jgi:hypothetical protein